MNLLDEKKTFTHFNFQVPLIFLTTDNSYPFTEPLVPYHVTVMAVNLAGPGEQEVKDFFTREGGVFPITQDTFYQKLSVYETDFY